MLAGLGLISRVNLVGRILQQPSHNQFGRFEYGSTHQYFQFLNRHSIELARLELRHQLLDLLVLGQEDLGREVFFFNPPIRAARVCSTMS